MSIKTIKRNMNTKLGKALKRLVGEETGAVMMEYVILAVLVAAAVTAAVIYFGNTQKNMIAVAGDAAAGNTANAEVRAEDARKKQDQGVNYANQSAKRFKNTTKGDTDATTK